MSKNQRASRHIALPAYEDYYNEKEGIKADEAVKRILATKASLGLHKDKAEGMVKDTQNLLPISPSKTKRVLLEIMGDFPSNDRVCASFKVLLEKEGFDVIIYEKEVLTEKGIAFDNIGQFKEKYDLVIYIANIETASNKTVSRLNWHTVFGLGNNMPWFVCEVPTMFISVGNPYHLLDAPMVKTYINGYCNSEYVIEAIVEKIMGRSEFKGTSPIDPFCGKWDTKQ